MLWSIVDSTGYLVILQEIVSSSDKIQALLEAMLEDNMLLLHKEWKVTTNMVFL